MNIHKNASMTPRGRAHLMREIERIGLKPAAAAAGLSERTARKWLHRWASQGAPGLLDRSSRPKRCPRRSDTTKVERAVALRRNQRLTYELIWPPYFRTRPIRNVAPVVQVERGVVAQPVAA